MENVCNNCGSTEGLTKDHIIPRWLYKRLGFWNIGIKKNLGKKNIMILCKKCNTNKSGYLNYTHPLSRMVLKMIADEINRRLGYK